MSQKLVIANGILWASAIVASALLGAPMFLTLVLLPSLATVSLSLSRRDAAANDCSDARPIR